PNGCPSVQPWIRAARRSRTSRRSAAEPARSAAATSNFVAIFQPCAPRLRVYARCSAGNRTCRCRARSRNTAPPAPSSTAASSTASGLVTTGTANRTATSGAGSVLRRTTMPGGGERRRWRGSTVSESVSGRWSSIPCHQAADAPWTTAFGPAHSDAARKRASSDLRKPVTRYTLLCSGSQTPRASRRSIWSRDSPASSAWARLMTPAWRRTYASSVIPGLDVARRRAVPPDPTSSPRTREPARRKITGNGTLTALSAVGVPLPTIMGGGAGRASGLGDAVGDERRAVVGDQAGGLADAQPGRGVADYPRPQRRAEAVEHRQRVEQLVDPPASQALFAVHAAGLHLVARRHDRDVRALPAQPRLADVLGQHPGLVEVGRQQVGVPGVELPQHREQGLVREQRLPQRLDPQRLGQAADGVLAEVVGEDPLPRVELHQRRDPGLGEVDEPVHRRLPPDVLDGQPDGVDAGLGGGLLQVRGGHVVLTAGVGSGPGEVDLRAGQLRPDLPP